MGRAKLTKKFIEKEKKRNSTFRKIKATLLKKAREFSILCNAPICIIIYPFKESEDQKQFLQQPEVFSFDGEHNNTEHNNAPNHEIVAAREIIHRYLTFPKDLNSKRSLILRDMFEDQELIRPVKEDITVKCPTNMISEFSVDQLDELLYYLDYKLELVRRKSASMKGVFVPFPALIMPDDHGFDQLPQVLNNNDIIESFGFNGEPAADQMEPMADNYGGVYNGIMPLQ